MTERGERAKQIKAYRGVVRVNESEQYNRDTSLVFFSRSVAQLKYVCLIVTICPNPSARS
jgi:hypothetical protein